MLNKVQNLGIKIKLLGFVVLVIILPYTAISVYSLYAASKTSPGMSQGGPQILGLIIFSLFVITVTYFISDHGIVRPLKRLQKGISDFEAVGQSARIHVGSKDEIGQLATAFNNMADNIQISSFRLHEEHARLEASINSLSIGFFMTDHDDKMTIMNEAAKSLLSRRVTDDSSVPAESQDWTIERVTEALKDSLSLDEAMKSRKLSIFDEVNFTDRIMRVFVGPIVLRGEQGALGDIGSVVLLEDITEAKIMERSKDEFFSIASHELRTPLTSIKGNASMIMQFYAELLKDKDLKDMVGDIHESSVRLIEIVNDFLDASRLEQGKMSFNNVATPLDIIIEGVLYEMTEVAKSKNLRLEFDRKTLGVLPKAWIDINKTKQVVYNLVGNASKFTEDGKISITTTFEKGFIKVLVTDTGRGISAESQQLLFHKFQQTGSSLLTRDTTRGTGLGLYISKLLVEGMGGRVALEKSVADEGSTFSFTVPIATAEQIAGADESDVVATDVKTGLAVTVSVDENDTSVRFTAAAGGTNVPHAVKV